VSAYLHVGLVVCDGVVPRRERHRQALQSVVLGFALAGSLRGRGRAEQPQELIRGRAQSRRHRAEVSRGLQRHFDDVQPRPRLCVLRALRIGDCAG